MDFIINYFQNDKLDDNISTNKIKHWCSIIKSIEEWDNNYYITANDKDSTMFVLKHDNLNYDDILKFLIIDKLVAFTFIEENTDNIIQNSIMDRISQISVIILSIKTDPDTKISHIIAYVKESINFELILYPTFGNSDKMLNKLKINEIFTLCVAKNFIDYKNNNIETSIRDILNPITYTDIITIKKLEMIKGKLSNFIHIETVEIAYIEDTELNKIYWIMNKDKEQPKIGSKYYIVYTKTSNKRFYMIIECNLIT
jgi:hypothetical protein